MLRHHSNQQAYSQGMFRAQQEVAEARRFRAELQHQALRASTPQQQHPGQQAESSAPEQPRDTESAFLELPLALQIKIASFLDPPSLCSLGQCSRRTLELVSDTSLWAHDEGVQRAHRAARCGHGRS